MRHFAVVLIFGSALVLTGAGEARAGAWCAWYDPYTYNCGFNTFQQCEATISGAGGYCAPNANQPPAAPQRRRR